MKPLKIIRKYLSAIGAKGGRKSRRAITAAQQAVMQQARRDALNQIKEVRDGNDS